MPSPQKDQRFCSRLHRIHCAVLVTAIGHGTVRQQRVQQRHIENVQTRVYRKLANGRGSAVLAAQSEPALETPAVGGLAGQVSSGSRNLQEILSRVK